MEDYILWKSWWLAAMYGASAERRMAIMDDMRNGIIISNSNPIN